MSFAVNLANSSTENKRRELDFYPTPSEVTHALMLFLSKEKLLSENSLIWEPACGDGAMSEVMASYGHNILSSDLRESGYGRSNVNFLEVPVTRHYEGIITNPPFNISAEFITKALKHAKVVAMVLKSQYWHASKRTQLFNENPPAYVLAMNWRPDFLNKERGGAPTMECIWTVWVEGNTDTRYRVLEKPKGVR